MNYVTTDYYLNILLNLMPKGKAWNLADDGIIYAILKSAAFSFKEVHNQVNNLIKELNPGQTTLLIEDFETLLELPEKCNRHTQDINNISLSERQLNALNKYLNKSLNTKQYIIDYAKTLGYEVEIEELREAKFDEGFSTFSSGDEANTINIIVTNVEKVRSCFGDFFDQDFGLIEQDNHVECMLDKIIPAHIQVVYTYK